VILPVLIAVAFITLAERKLLGIIQRRRGPNIVGSGGFLQAFADGLKLFSEEIFLPSQINLGLYFFVAVFALGVAFLPWGVIPYGNLFMDLHLGILYLFFVSSISVYAVLMSGWVSNSKYAFDGAVRGTAQMVSYEVSIGLLFLSVCLCCRSLSLSEIVKVQEGVWLAFPLFPIMVMFFVSALAETNRVPFDLTEGESELVSGFNVEYRSFLFAMFFLAEYIHILLMSVLGSVLFLGGSFLFVKGGLLVFWFIWVRGTLPRVRYDQLMELL